MAPCGEPLADAPPSRVPPSPSATGRPIASTSSCGWRAERGPTDAARKARAREDDRRDPGCRQVQRAAQITYAAISATPLSLQLLLQLVEEVPVGPLGEDLLR